MLRLVRDDGVLEDGDDDERVPFPALLSVYVVVVAFPNRTCFWLSEEAVELLEIPDDDDDNAEDVNGRRLVVALGEERLPLSSSSSSSSDDACFIALECFTSSFTKAVMDC